MHIWALGLSCETPAAPPDRAAGARTRQPENSKRAHFRAPALQTPPKFHARTPRERKKKENCGGGGKKKREILGPPPFKAPPFGAPPFGAPHFVVPKFNIQKLAEIELAEVEIGRSRNWPKSKLAEADHPRARAHSSRELPDIGIDHGFFGRDREDVLPILCVKCRNSSTGCSGATVVDRKGASDYVSSFLTAFIKSLGFKRILVRSDNGRSLLSLIERVMSNVTGVELVHMTSPEGDHAANGLAVVGVREVKAQTRILRS